VIKELSQNKMKQGLKLTPEKKKNPQISKMKKIQSWSKNSC